MYSVCWNARAKERTQLPLEYSLFGAGLILFLRYRWKSSIAKTSYALFSREILLLENTVWAKRPWTRSFLLGNIQGKKATGETRSRWNAIARNIDQSNIKIQKLFLSYSLRTIHYLSPVRCGWRIYGRSNGFQGERWGGGGQSSSTEYVGED